jgi:hypothetical protein
MSDASSPEFGRIWPNALPQIGAVGASFDTGYGKAASVPEGKMFCPKQEA